MTWDNPKNTASDPDNPNADEQLTASEWNTHVDEGHWPSDELQFQIDNGDPVLVDPQNSNEIVARYDRGKGSWVIDTLEADDANIKRPSNNQHYASEYDGSDADARLDNVLSAAQDGDRIWLESGGEYNDNRTINTQVMFCGAAEAAGDSPRIFGDWSVGIKFVSFKHIRIDGSLTLAGFNTVIGGSNDGTGQIVVDGDDIRIALVRDGEVTFNSGTTGGIIASSTDVNVTDNGNNTVGDIA
jgi:hypothetical protein